LPVRAFIALDLPKETQTYLDCITILLKQTDYRASWTRPGNFHLTLKFLGDIPESTISKITTRLEEIQFKLPISYSFAKLGGFPNLKKPKILWFGLDSELSIELAKDVDDACHELGFSLEDKAFMPHVTLGRVKEPGEVDLEKLSTEFPKPSKNGVFERLVLFRSELLPSGPIYSPLWEKKG